MVHQHTGFDHPLTYEHMQYMKERYQLPLIDVYSKRYKTVPEVMHGEVIIPSRFARACTKHLKTRPWFAWLKEQPDHASMLVLLGMRAQESADRKEKYGELADGDEFEMGDISTECPKALRKVRTQLPIVSWSTQRVFEFLRDAGDKVNPLYARGHKRVGCYPCVLAGQRDFKLAARDPVGRAHIEAIRQEIVFIKSRRPLMNEKDFFDHDLAAMLDKKEADPFGFNDDEADDNAGGCSWCNL